MRPTGAEVSPRAAQCRVPWGLLLLALAACQGDPAPPSTDVPPALSSAASAAPSAGPARSEPQLCDVLAGVVATESEGFARLRERPLAAAQWLGSKTLPGTERCTIEGEVWPRARYSCSGTPFADARRHDAELAFEALADELGACLDSPIWFPRTWQRGNAFEFAMGERLQAWTDHSTWPPSQVVLKMQQDASGRAYRVRLDLEAVP